ncbi:MAG: urease accessory protein [Magnetovibrio sp.]|nr:urease accessory protein [Magnetovibrio sp.]
MTSVLVLGFLIGFRHAFEPDHLAAMASLATRTTTLHKAVRQGFFWGLGHTLTLFILCSIILSVNTAISDNISRILEAAVGFMLVILGADVVRKVHRDRIHFHIHKHSDGLTHFHAHSHRGGKADFHNSDNHNHDHIESLPYRSLAVGLMHGLAGSSALIILTLGSVHSFWDGLTYIALFGTGSIFGMGIFSAAICIPMRTVNSLDRAHTRLKIVIGSCTVMMGVTTLFKSLSL